MIQTTFRIVSISMMIEPTFQVSLHSQFSAVDRIESDTRRNKIQVKFINGDDKLVEFQDQASQPNRTVRSAIFFQKKSRHGLKNSRITLKAFRKFVTMSRRTSIPDMLFIRNREQIPDKVSNGVSTVQSFLTDILSRKRQAKSTRPYFGKSDRVGRFRKFVNSGKLW